MNTYNCSHRIIDFSVFSVGVVKTFLLIMVLDVALSMKTLERKTNRFGTKPCNRMTGWQSMSMMGQQVEVRVGNVKELYIYK
jgi:hypothetical protein